MIMITIYSFLYGIFLWLDYPKVKKSGKKSIQILYLCITLFSYILIILIAFDIPIPSPTILIEKIVTSIVDIN